MYSSRRGKLCYSSLRARYAPYPQCDPNEPPHCFDDNGRPYIERACLAPEKDGSQEASRKPSYDHIGRFKQIDLGPEAYKYLTREKYPGVCPESLWTLDKERAFKDRPRITKFGPSYPEYLEKPKQKSKTIKIKNPANPVNPSEVIQMIRENDPRLLQMHMEIATDHGTYMLAPPHLPHRNPGAPGGYHVKIRPSDRHTMEDTTHGHVHVPGHPSANVPVTFRPHSHISIPPDGGQGPILHHAPAGQGQTHRRVRLRLQPHQSDEVSSKQEGPKTSEGTQTLIIPTSEAGVGLSRSGHHVIHVTTAVPHEEHHHTRKFQAHHGPESINLTHVKALKHGHHETPHQTLGLSKSGKKVIRTTQNKAKSPPRVQSGKFGFTGSGLDVPLHGLGTDSDEEINSGIGAKNDQGGGLKGGAESTAESTAGTPPGEKLELRKPWPPPTFGPVHGAWPFRTRVGTRPGCEGADSNHSIGHVQIGEGVTGAGCIAVVRDECYFDDPCGGSRNYVKRKWPPIPPCWANYPSLGSIAIRRDRLCEPLTGTTTLNIPEGEGLLGAGQSVNSYWEKDFKNNKQAEEKLIPPKPILKKRSRRTRSKGTSYKDCPTGQKSSESSDSDDSEDSRAPGFT